MPLPKINAQDLFGKAFDDTFGIAGGFSDEAVEDFYVFIKEGEFVSDGELTDPDLFFWLDPVYRIKRSELLGDRGMDGEWIRPPLFPRGLIYRKGSQLGATIWSVLFILWLCIDPQRGLRIGVFWPNEKELISFIQLRFKKILESSAKMMRYLEDSEVNNTRGLEVLSSTIYFRYVQGKSGADSIPLDVVIADEVRLFDTPGKTLQRIEERTGRSRVALMVLMSTVGSTGDYMENAWGESNQVKYFSLCPEGCRTELHPDPRGKDRLIRSFDEGDTERVQIPGVVLSDYLPTRMIERLDKDRATYRCPCCGSPMKAEKGGYQVTRPTADGMYGLEFARTLNPLISPMKVMEKYEEAEDMKQFMNGFLAKPWLDPEGAMVQEDHWEEALSEHIHWTRGFSTGGDVYLGADFRTEEVHVVIGQVGNEYEAGRLLHLEVIQGLEWGERLQELIDDYFVTRAIIDYQPFTSETLAFAQKNIDVVYLVRYVAGDLLRRAVDSKKANRQVSLEARERNMVIADQTKSLKLSLRSFAQGKWLVPREPLFQSNYKDGTKTRQIHGQFDIAGGEEGKGREGFKQHLMGLALVHLDDTVKNRSGETVHEAAGFSEYFVDASGFDPHFAHAFNYMVLASRLDGAGLGVHAGSNDAQRVDRGVGESVSGFSGLTPSSLSVRGQIANKMGIPVRLLERPRICGNCQNFEAYNENDGQSLGECSALGYELARQDPECSYRLYRERPAPSRDPSRDR